MSNDIHPFSLGNPKFSLGQVVATSGALDLLDRAAVNGHALITRHQRGDWGNICDEDAQQNTLAITEGMRILSSYDVTPTERIWIITEADRSSTTLLLPEEY